MRQLRRYTDKHGESNGRRLYGVLQREAAYASAAARMRKRLGIEPTGNGHNGGPAPKTHRGAKTVARVVVGDLTVYMYSYGVSIRDKGRGDRVITYMHGRVMDSARSRKPKK